MIFQRNDETLSQAIARTCNERGHDFSHPVSHRCHVCNIPYNEVGKNTKIVVSPRRDTESFDNDYRFSEGRHVQ